MTGTIFVALDLETTGLSADLDRVVEVGAVRFDASGAELGRFDELVNPLRPVSPRAFAVHGIPDAELAGAPPATVVLRRFLAWLDEAPGSTLLAHNASFDAAFLGRELARIGLERPGTTIADTLALSRRVLPGATHRLDALAERFGLDPGEPHRALADALRVKGLWMALTDGAAPVGLVAYPVIDTRGGPPVPAGWERLAEAIASRSRVRMTYEGGSLGPAPREITPRRFHHMGGVAYVVAECHESSREKTFRLDRVTRWEVAPGPAPK